MTTEESVHALIAEHLAVEPHLVINEARLKEDLGADDLDGVELTMLMEERFNIEISDHECDRVLTVGDAVDLVTGKIQSC